MNNARGMTKSGRAWVILLLIPPAIIVGGLIALFYWQGAKGGVTPKWKKAPMDQTNQPGSRP
ncbi:MAG: hypothetical protein IT581_05705 [Verrucomicrobiales bacterium]|nr:hypothetical protein [Verrucomicrobiales bacterium]